MPDPQQQPPLFEEEELIPWLKEWQDMPEFSHEDLAPKYQLVVNFLCAADVEDFCELIGQRISASNGRQLQSIWFPDQEIGHMVNKRYIARGLR